MCNLLHITKRRAHEPTHTSTTTNHRLNLLQVRESAEYHFSNPEVEKVFSISRDLFHGKIAEVQEEYKDKTLPSEVVRMIGSITGAKTFMNQEEVAGEINMCRALEAYVAEKMEEAAKETEMKMCKGLENYIAEKMEEAAKETEMKMCKGLENYIAEKMEEAAKEASIEAEKRGIGIGKNEGIVIGIINAMQAMDASVDRIMEQLMQQLSVSEETARNYLSKHGINCLGN